MLSLLGVQRNKPLQPSPALKQNTLPSAASCEAVWLRRLLEDLSKKQSSSSVIYCDNILAISIAKNPIHHGWMKHIDTRYHFIRDLFKDEQIFVLHSGTNDQLVDVFTKALNYQKFEFFSLQAWSQCFS